LYYALLNWWLLIERTQVRDYHKRVATVTLSKLSSLMRPRGSYVLGAAVAIGLSVALTTVAINVAGILRGYGGGFAPYEVYLINLFFDGATVAVTAVLLALMVRFPWYGALALAMCDLIAAFLLGVLCLISLGIWYGFCSNCFAQIGWSFIGDMIVDNIAGAASGDPFLVAFASTTLVPTAVYIAFLVILLVSKPILRLARAAALLFLERAVEVENPAEMMVFSLTSAVISVLALLSGLAVELV